MADGVIDASIYFTTSGGTPTVVQSTNVSSLGDDAVGSFTINFTDDLASDNYMFVGGCEYNTTGYRKLTLTELASARTVSLIKIYTTQSQNTLADMNNAGVIIGNS